MSGHNPNPPPQRPQGGAPPSDPNADPSMEDILASIRRILSEDEAQAASPSAAEPDDGVLQLDQAMMVPGSKPAPPPIATSPAVQPAPPAPPPVIEEEPRAMEPTSPATPPRTDAPAAEGLVAPEAATATAGLVGDLVRTLSAERTTRTHSGGPTIEDVVRQEIRPLLKAWLDANLPTLVERQVRAEIERVVGRAVP